jgi:alkylhydroperoxidase family enzyme
MQDTHAPSRLGLVSSAATSATLTGASPVLPDINVFRAMANADTLYPKYMEFVRTLFTPLELAADLERMVVLRVAERSDCFYVWRQNAVVAQSVGVTPEQLAALESGNIGSRYFSDAERAALAFTDEVINLIEATDQAYAAVREHLSERAVTEMLYVIGTYMFVVRLVRTGRVPLDATPAPSPQRTSNPPTADATASATPTTSRRREA